MYLWGNGFSELIHLGLALLSWSLPRIKTRIAKFVTHVCITASICRLRFISKVIMDQNDSDKLLSGEPVYCCICFTRYQWLNKAHVQGSGVRIIISMHICLYYPMKTSPLEPSFTLDFAQCVNTTSLLMLLPGIYSFLGYIINVLPYLMQTGLNKMTAIVNIFYSVKVGHVYFD